MDNTIEHAKAALRGYVRQLERFESMLPSRDDMAYDSAKFQSSSMSGVLYLRLALDDARRALASDDPERITVTAVKCGTLVLDGFVRSLRHKKQLHQLNAALRRGENLKQKSDERYGPWRVMLAKLKAEGVKPSVAFATVKRRMQAKNIALPSDRQLREQLNRKSEATLG